MQFESPSLLALLVCIPLIIILFIRAQRINAQIRARFGSWAAFHRMIPAFAPRRNRLKFTLASLALSLMILAWANPRMGSRSRKVERAGVDVYLALDLSRSMWAKDVQPRGLDRLEKARLFSLELLQGLANNRVGLIFFAGEAFLQMPLTLDHSSAQVFLYNGLEEVELMQGSTIEKVLELVQKSEIQPDGKQHQKAVVFVTDGEEHSPKALEAAKQARQNGIFSYTISVGSNQGAKIPLQRENELGFHRDKRGEEVVTATNKKMLAELAQIGGGQAFDIDQGKNILPALLKDFKKLEQQEFDELQYDDFDSYYQYLLAPALLFLFFEFFLAYRKNHKR